MSHLIKTLDIISFHSRYGNYYDKYVHMSITRSIDFCATGLLSLSILQMLANRIIKLSAGMIGA